MGETKSSLDYLLETHESDRGVQCLPVEIHINKLFSYKVIHKNEYHCYECGAK